MNTKILWILSGIIGFLMILVVVGLAIAKKIKVGALLIFITIIILIVIGINLIFLFVNRNKKINVNKDGEAKKTITLEDARIIANKEMLNEQHSDYEKSRIVEAIWSKGSTNSPVYVRCSEGVFDKVYYLICVNMENKRTSIKEYPYTKSFEELEKALDCEANLISTEPKATARFEEELIERPTGERVTRRRDIGSEQHPEAKKEGGME